MDPLINNILQINLFLLISAEFIIIILRDAEN